VKRVKWTYEAELDYIMEVANGEWVIGFLNKDGNPYECPHTAEETLIRKLEKLEGKRLKVTVEINEKLDRWDKQYPKLLDVRCFLT
jgi:hypothetical protein